MLEEKLQIISGIYLWIWDHLFIINILFSLLIIFFQRRNPTTVWAWLLLLYFIPVLGFVLYLILGQNFRKERRDQIRGAAAGRVDIPEEIKIERPGAGTIQEPDPL